MKIKTRDSINPETEKVQFEKWEHFRLFADLSPDGALVNCEGRFVFANQAAARLLGASHEDEILAQTPFDFILPEFHSSVRERIARVLKQEKYNPIVEQKWKRLDGTVVDLEVAAGRATWNGSPAVVVFLRDITDRKRAENELIAAKAAAEEGNRAKSEFLTTVSHEICTPMTVTIGALELLSTMVSDDMQKELVEMALASTESLLHLIDDILDFSKIEAGKMRLQMQKCSSLNCIEKAQAQFALQARHKGLVLSTKISPRLQATLVCDQNRVNQIMTNLVGNAIKFTERGSITIGADAEGDSVRFFVRDTGIGIPHDKIGQLFKSFHQLDTSNTRKHGGAGLGLAISKALVEMMGGEIGVESIPGAGSTFFFTLPLSPTSSEPQEEDQK